MRVWDQYLTEQDKTTLRERPHQVWGFGNRPALVLIDLYRWVFGDRERPMLEYKIKEFKRQLAAGVPFAVGSDVGPFPHGTQARELELMVKYGMKPLAVLQADLLNGAKLLGWAGQIGELKPGYFADVIAVPGNPLDDIRTLQHVSFVMKGGVIEKPPAQRLEAPRHAP